MAWGWLTRPRGQADDDRAPCEETVIARKLKSNCRNVESSYKACLLANKSHPERCDGLREQLRHAQAGVLCPDLAKVYDHCMLIEVNRASRTHDEVNRYACADVMDKIERCLGSGKNRRYIADAERKREEGARGGGRGKRPEKKTA